VRVSKEAPAVAGTVAHGAPTAGATLVTTAEPAQKVEYVTVNAPLTGVFYRSPSPQAEAFVQVGSQIAEGDVIGLIEAMKLFNEIKSDLAGRVARVVAETGTLVKAKQPLIEVEPL
jgi:acetyl-CoA carboxylase biotin carboxyl carrier protein